MIVEPHSGTEVLLGFKTRKESKCHRLRVAIEVWPLTGVRNTQQYAVKYGNMNVQGLCEHIMHTQRSRFIQPVSCLKDSTLKATVAWEKNQSLATLSIALSLSTDHTFTCKVWSLDSDKDAHRIPSLLGYDASLGCNRRFGETYRLHLHELGNLEDIGNTFFRNTTNHSDAQ
jgi:hypothetical protein